MSRYGTPISCSVSLAYFKSIVESVWHRNALIDAYKEYAAGNYDVALIKYEIAASMVCATLLGFFFHMYLSCMQNTSELVNSVPET